MFGQAVSVSVLCHANRHSHGKATESERREYWGGNQGSGAQIYGMRIDLSQDSRGWICLTLKRAQERGFTKEEDSHTGGLPLLSGPISCYRALASTVSTTRLRPLSVPQFPYLFLFSFLILFIIPSFSFLML